MANREHIEVLNKGVSAWEEWRTRNPGVKPDLRMAKLGGDFSGADFIGADFSGADLSGTELVGADLSWAKLDEADLSGARLGGADLSQAELPGAKLIEADLSGAKLVGADLGRTDLSRARLGGANLSGADLGGANLAEADLRAADVSQANLSRADLVGAKLGGADLRETDLTEANLSGANLNGADLTASLIGSTSLGNVDLQTAKGLERVRHYFPSSIGIDTIFQSKGNIPEIFLRGAGVPEPFVVQMKALVGAMEPIQFYSCFISYSNRDQQFAERLYADLQVRGVRSWFAPHDIQGGKKLHEQIDDAIRIHDRLLLILSLESINSEWVKTEIAKARKREAQQKRKVLFPLRLVPFDVLRDWECFDGDMGKDSAREIREYFIPDFSNWKDHDAYRGAFDRLMRDLRAEDSPTVLK